MKLNPEQIEQYATMFLQRSIALARSESTRLKYPDAEELESIAIAELGVALINCPDDSWDNKRVWGHCRTCIKNAISDEVRHSHVAQAFKERAIKFRKHQDKTDVWEPRQRVAYTKMHGHS